MVVLLLVFQKYWRYLTIWGFDELLMLFLVAVWQKYSPWCFRCWKCWHGSAWHFAKDQVQWLWLHAVSICWLQYECWHKHCCSTGKQCQPVGLRQSGISKCFHVEDDVVYWAVTPFTIFAVFLSLPIMWNNRSTREHTDLPPWSPWCLGCSEKI